MSRLIDADRLLFEVSNAFAELHIGKREILREEDILKMIYNSPVAEEHFVKHGRWIEREKDDNRCSLCGWGVWVNTNNYCPRCGARMDGDENGQFNQQTGGD